MGLKKIAYGNMRIASAIVCALEPKIQSSLNEMDCAQSIQRIGSIFNLKGYVD